MYETCRYLSHRTAVTRQPAMVFARLRGERGSDGVAVDAGWEDCRGVGDGFAGGIKSNFEGEYNEEPRLDRTDTGRNKTILARPSHDRRAGSGPLITRIALEELEKCANEFSEFSRF